MILLPMIITIRVSKLSHKLLFLVPIIELGIVSIFNAIINHNGNGGVRFDILWLIVGAIVGTIFPLIFLIMKKQNVMLILSIVILLFELSMLISEKSNSYIAVKILPFYIGVVALSFQKDKTK
ncbi:hypothetical protein [Clostridium sp. C2-6-12]|uniref:hypothetical protein n=1 Tax=Clostridium sp. C2-6-12 TaxID=2698832 RepID=UPI001A9B9A48|nr:hypothetical protein [Clostridium sp. C2-6-12]